jgi:hypothetical protein
MLQNLGYQYSLRSIAVLLLLKGWISQAARPYRPATTGASYFMERMMVKDFAYTNGKELLHAGRGCKMSRKCEHRIGDALHDSYPMKYVD